MTQAERDQKIQSHLRIRTAREENSERLSQIEILILEIAESGDVEALRQIATAAVTKLADLA